MINFSSFLSKINFKNLDKFFKHFDQGMSVFNKCMGDMLSELSSDVKESDTRSNDRQRQNQRNLDLLWGSKSNTKLWSD